MDFPKIMVNGHRSIGAFGLLCRIERSFVRVARFSIIFCFVLVVGCQKVALDSASVPQARAAGSDGWVSSGGELFEDKQNPWWLRNVSKVGYCLRVAPDFKVSEDRIRTLIEIALRYWKHEFASADAGFFGASPVEMIRYGEQVGQTAIEPLGIATQNFHDVPCAEAELEFVFGESVLTPPQRAYFPDLKKYVSAAVRTQYDRVRLSAKGFLYFSSAQGKWSEEWRLLRVIAHELGHAFGVRHIGPRCSIMAERFPETTLHTQVSHKELEEERFSPFDSEAAIAYRLPILFGFPPRIHSGGSDFIFHSKPRSIWITKIPPELSGAREAISGTLLNLDLRPTFEPAVVVDLPAEQRVFSDARRNGIQVLFGPSVFRSAAGPAHLFANGVIPVHLLFEGPVLWKVQLTAADRKLLRFKRFFDFGVQLFY